MPRGPTWTPYEDEVLRAAREVSVSYKHLTIVLPHRSDMACRERFRILREQAGIPPRPMMTREQGWSSRMIKRGSDMLAEAMMRYQERASA